METPPQTPPHDADCMPQQVPSACQVLNQATRRTQKRTKRDRAIGIINATWTAMTGARSPAFPDFEPWPFSRIDGSFVIPATLDDYHTLRKFQDLTDAKRAKSSFQKQSSHCHQSAILVREMPTLWHEQLKEKVARDLLSIFNSQPFSNSGRPVTIATSGSVDITLLERNVSRTIQPDASLDAARPVPFLAIEIADSQSRDSLLQRAQHYKHGSVVGVSTLIMLKIYKEPTYRVDLWVYRYRKVSAPTSGNPQGYRMENNEVCNEVEVYPQDHTAGRSITLTLRDILPNDIVAQPDQACVQIPLSAFHDAAAAAIDRCIIMSSFVPPEHPRPNSHSGSEPDDDRNDNEPISSEVSDSADSDYTPGRSF